MTILLISAVMLAAAAAGCQDDSERERRAAAPRCGAGDTYASWSPDGRTIAFQSDRGTPWKEAIWVVDSAGANMRRLTNGFEPTWASDGRIVFRRTNSRLVSVRRDGTGLRPLLVRAAGIEPAVAPDGRHIAMLSPRADALIVVGLDTKAKHVVSTGGSNANSPSWSPDGKRLAWSNLVNRYRSIYVFDDLRPLREPPGLRRQAPMTRDPGIYTMPAWAPGDRIAAVEYSRANGRIVTIDPHTKRVADVTSGEADDSHPSWAPDGKKLIFSRAERPGRCAALYVVPADGGRPSRLTQLP